MIVKPETYKHLVALQKGKIVKISNMILRKIAPVEKQDANLTNNSVCIVCNFRFLENRVNWSKKIKAICHPFKDDSIFPNNIKKYLFSESDFCDRLITHTTNKMKKWDKQKYDFVYFTLISREGTRSKGAYLLPLINEVTGLLKLKGLIINYATRETSKHKGTIYHGSIDRIKKSISKFKNLIIINKKYSCEEVCAIMLASKFVLLPSNADASPRLIVEPLVRNRPLVINSRIYGGWKYINEYNGAFFDSPTIEECYEGKYKKDYDYYRSSLIKSIEKVLSIKDNNIISKNFYKKYGFLNSSIKLAKIVNSVSETNYEAVCFKEWKEQLKKKYKV